MPVMEIEILIHGYRQEWSWSSGILWHERYMGCLLLHLGKRPYFVVDKFDNLMCKQITEIGTCTAPNWWGRIRFWYLYHYPYSFCNLGGVLWWWSWAGVQLIGQADCKQSNTQPALIFSETKQGVLSLFDHFPFWTTARTGNGYFKLPTLRDHDNPSLKLPVTLFKKNFKNSLFFLSSLLARRIAVKAYKKQSSSAHKYTYNALGESPRTRSPSPPSSTQLFHFLFFAAKVNGQIGKGERGAGGWGKAETRRHKGNLRGLCNPSLSLFSSISPGVRRIAKNWGYFFSRGG